MSNIIAAGVVLVSQNNARDSKPVIRWCQWVAAYTGSRVGEIAERSTGDIRKMGNMWVIDILLENREPDASLKTEAAHRTVALHSALLAEGFLDYVEMVRRDYGEGPLCPMLRPNRDGRRSTPASNAVSKWMRNRLKITDKRIGPNHSWRHLFEKAKPRVSARLRRATRRSGLPTDRLRSNFVAARLDQADSHAQRPGNRGDVGSPRLRPTGALLHKAAVRARADACIDHATDLNFSLHAPEGATEEIVDWTVEPTMPRRQG
jgi:integrase